MNKWLATIAGGALALAGSLVLTTSAAHAVGTLDPAISGDPNASNGTIAFFDSSGNQISSGQLNAPFASYAVASSATKRSGTVRATLFVATPDHTKTNSLQWANQQLTAASVWPLTGAPAGVQSAEGPGQPAVAIKSTDGDLAGAFAASTNDPTTGYDHIMQIRMEDSGVGQPVSPPFWATDVWIDTVHNTWTQVYPTPPAPKTSTSFSTLTANPASPAQHGSKVTISSTLSAADSSHPAGTVHLFDGTTDLGAATFDATTGAASETDAPSDGSHSYTFRFTPTDTATYTGTTSAALPYTVNPVTATNTSLTASPAGSATYGATVTLTATVDKAAAGSVSFFDGSTAIGSPVAVTVNSSNATASTSTSTLTVGSHSLTATFTPTNPNAFGASTSPASSYTITKIPTTTTLNIMPSTAVTAGTPVTLNATINPSVNGGTVQFYDGTTALGAPQPVSSNNATMTVPNSTVPAFAQGSHSIKATFVPSSTDAPTMLGSTSATQTLTVTAAPVTPTVTVSSSPSGQAVQGSNVTFTATFSPSSAVGTVQFMDGSTALGSPVNVTGGKATLTTNSLALGSHSITAAYTSTSNAYNNTTSGAYSFSVIPPPTATTTTLSVAPTSPAPYAATETLTANVTGGTNPAGTVAFFDGTAKVGSSSVSAGVATLTTTLASGTHTLKAVFTPTDATAFTGSQSAPQTYVVSAPPATSTTTTLTASPSPVSVGHAETLTATVALGAPTYGRPAAVGSVEFFDGSTSLGTSPVSNGTAKLTTSGLALGTHTLHAVFTPTMAANYGSSTSSNVTLTVKPAATITSVLVNGKAVSSGAVLKGGDTVQLNAVNFVAGEKVNVVLRSTPVTLTSVNADSTGAVTATVTLPKSISAGSHTLTLSASTDSPAFAFSVAAPKPTATPTPTPTPAAPSGAAAGGATPVGGSTGAGAGSGGSALASTGAQIFGGVTAGLLLIVVGALAVAGSRRRRSH